jgi:hypothetical protein
MNFYKIMFFSAACLGIATVTEPMGCIRIANRLKANKQKDPNHILNETIHEFNGTAKRYYPSTTHLLEAIKKQLKQQSDSKYPARLLFNVSQDWDNGRVNFFGNQHNSTEL